MNQTIDSTATTRRPGVLGVHSLNRFVFSVPDLDVAQRFYSAFGLDVRRSGDRLDLHTFGAPHCWGTVFGNGQPKRLQYLSFGIYAEDLEAFKDRLAAFDTAPAHALSDGQGLWVRDSEGTPIQIVVAPKMSPSSKSVPTQPPVVAAGRGAAPNRTSAPLVHPRRLSHMLLYTADVDAQLDFYSRALGLRLSDMSKGIVAFMHGAHASDHHLLAFAKSHAPGLHHSSWDVGSVNEIGLGAEQMRSQGYTEGWGVGRHVLGSNYFHYVRDPWGSYAEYSFDIDFVPADLEWPATDHPPEDSFYVWGPQVPEDFVTNLEVPAIAAAAP
jgi:catechol 2,3-dioxygenase-like lactoylglutathione lyase family enzyme